VDGLVTAAVAVCEHTGIMLTRPLREAVDEAIAATYDHKPSMLHDVLARGATEIDVLDSGIGRKAAG
jgi:2-dehydropantoate 2-reductase